MKNRIVTSFPGIGLRGWLFRHLFPAEYDHMRHLVSDVIRLEREKTEFKEADQPTLTISDSLAESIWSNKLP